MTDSAMPETRTSLIMREKLHARLRPVSLEIRDDSHLHAGHAGAREGGHYAVTVVAAAFEGLSTLARHRLVYDILKEELKVTIHALELTTLAPSEWPGAGG
ncbi:MAG TPA: BolA family protein [Candidatus Polarisedimenticolia bacterium]|nr:BolA family protein [Candidatus Polarisedimenticolia bacterium]